ncbi:MAG: hypothetical protein QF903_02740 [Planctomycetota bacterium]|jgi:hypothetical protein|nr:hypothetical protein [Planctomycetota bacterium]MDP6761239.1 hypothetical protein [Planctomycetota bacterium]MDP6988379.1 hypothetical protein [Planctomycetota bacterium]
MWFPLLATLAAVTPCGDAPSWTLQAQLLPDDQGGHVGIDASLSGDTAVFGANSAAGSGPGFYGAAYVFVRNAAGWSQQQKLVQADGEAGSWFGFSAAVSGDTIVVGAFKDDDAGVDAGSAYVFARAGTTWTQEAKLLPDAPSGEVEFGRAVAASGNTVVVGARSHMGATWDEGAVYVFVRDAGVWSRQARLTPADATGGMNFGDSVAIDGDTLLVGHTGGGGPAYVYVRSGATWSEQARLFVHEPTQPHALSVAVRANTAVIGAPSDQVAGRAWVFSRSGTAWAPVQKLRPLDGHVGDWFGKSVATDGERVAVGAFLEDSGPADAGAAYVFERVGVGWYERAKLVDPNGALWDRFGAAVSMDAGLLVVGAYNDDDAGGDGGSGFAFAAPAPVGSPFCFGDGSGSSCPCGNESSPGVGTGCDHSGGQGAQLAAFVSASVADDDLVLRGAPLLPDQAALLFAADEEVNGGTGVWFGDGLRCAGTNVVRLGVEFPDLQYGFAHWGPGLGATGGWVPGSTRRFQVWFRDSVGGPCGSTFNLSNALVITFGP